MSTNIATKVKIIKLPHGASLDLPQYLTQGSAGLDLYAAISSSVILKPHVTTLIPTGISIQLPEGFEGQVRSRSGLAAKHSISVLNSPGTIDSDYRGEIKVILINHSQDNFIIEPGARIAQLVVGKYERIIWEEEKELETTARGTSGLGSTGI